MANNIISQTAWAKINLDLLITGRRTDGYHLLDSLVVFADFGDEISVRPANHISLKISGPFSGRLGTGEDNIILQAARKLRHKFHIQQGAQISLVKNLPVAAGLGGGSADAAATLRALMALWDITDELGDLPVSLGADVPACMASKTLHMSGIGDVVRPVRLAFPLALLLVNPQVAVSTAHIFKNWEKGNSSFSKSRFFAKSIIDRQDVIKILAISGNDLERTACVSVPQINDCLAQLEQTDKCRFSGMSGSGATCFALYDDIEAARKGADYISAEFPHWWGQTVNIR